MFAGKKSAQIREILISESAWEEMTCLFAPSLEHGEAGFFFIENDQQSPWARDVKKFILENNGEIAKLRIAVHLGTMDIFYIKPAKAVLEMINNS